MLDAFATLMDPLLLAVTLAGVTLGIVWGALPGLSTTMAMGLLIGLTASLDQNPALCFMLGVYTGSVFGGAISAVLIAIPGTPDAVPTMIEGTALARKGEGGQALGMAIAASFVGNWVGIGLLILFIPMLLGFALSFRSYEMFMLAMLGILVCGSMSAGASPVKGWIAGWLGLLMAFVGLDPINGVPRFTFGVRALEDGLSYVAILIGVFGLTEILKTLPAAPDRPAPPVAGRVIPPLAKLMRHLWAAIRSSVIGTLAGAVPGAGANVASFLAYDIGRRWAKPEERAKWGKGSYEAIVCAETANNANIGGSMLPTLALGIPGNAPAAALIAALQLKAVNVGPTIEIDHPGLIWFIYAALIVANLFMFGAALALIKPCVKLFALPRGLLLSLILPVCVLGAWSVRLSLFDVWVMVAAGVAGYALVAARFPVAPVVLGVILAPLADENLRRTLMIFDRRGLDYAADQWIGHVLVLAFLLVLAESAIRVVRKRREIRR
ncbi:tripartite tricarboxylate transporter permease [Jannaschia aquimarina]|uniref:Tripartite tricarboxylate transporter TctA family protein n=1 Tax=Jannaschia aquimarina TaxID=935700 RepID=A0A0D1EPJ9_9RHOB|nr:tripartite tricarboxylate transporter permease [Jannaschia aquimarina]KIT17585.1 Tripartite tricarboxylate transporter TctA family protein [Jannaschia aquimarina]SNS72155.1 putative tricarboxylic transport membrane protein [Jannaschia aquimarina]